MKKVFVLNWADTNYKNIKTEIELNQINIDTIAFCPPAYSQTELAS